jgi:hypothetical protein
MKNQVLLFSVLILTNTVNAQISDKELITQVVNQFAQGADNRDTVLLDQILDTHFRAAVNRALGSTQLQVIDKTTYLNLIKEKKLGGDKRMVSVQNIIIHESTATAEVIFEGSKLNFTTFISMIKNEDQTWTIIQDLPIIKSK